MSERVTEYLSDGIRLLEQERDTLRAGPRPLRAENERLRDNVARLTSNPADHRYWEGRCRDAEAELEAARGLLRDMRHAARINPSCQCGMVNPCRCGYCVDLRVDAFLNVTHAAERAQQEQPQ